jgi:hypothetical protein
MKRFIFIVFFVLLSNICSAQNFVSEGDKLRQGGNLKEAIEAYKTDFHKSSKNWKNTYNLACAYALTFQKDSAYHYLNIALKDDTSLWALADADLYALIDDPRWFDIERRQLNRFQKHNGQLEQPEYALKLLNVILKDQALDYYIDQAKSYYIKNGNLPQWYYPLGSYKQEIYKNEYDKMLRLIDQYGWPKYSKVGKLAADAPLLVINHHESDSVRKKHLAQIKQACMEKEGSCMEFAKIQDRILVNENKPQIYGMQFRYNSERNLEPFPIIDPEYVDQRRNEIGLEPLKDYLKRKINFEWTIIQKE